MKSLLKFADSRQKTARRFRQKRFSVFLDFIGSLPCRQNIKVLDVGGTPEFWEDTSFLENKNASVSILNLEEVVQERRPSDPRVTFLAGDACRMDQFAAGEFDVVFSNSVIEHVGGWEEQMKMAQEIRRVGKHYFVQTPNYFFPLEPHFLTPGFQFFPVSLRAFLIRHFDLGWYRRTKSHEESIRLASSIRLLRKSELRQLFPKAKIRPEIFLGLTKSFMVFE